MQKYPYKKKKAETLSKAQDLTRVNRLSGIVHDNCELPNTVMKWKILSRKFN